MPLLIFVVAFLLNFAWEHLHAPLYANYRGGEITDWVLFRATLADAGFITAIGLPFLASAWFRRRLPLAVVFGLVLAVGIEWWALSTGRWAYGPAMPIVPLLGTGFTPTVQLGLLAYATLRLLRIRDR